MNASSGGEDDRRHAGTPTLRTTGYAVLGLLEGGPMTTAELIHEFHTTYGHCWDRTDPLIYEQSRKLIALGHISVIPDGPRRLLTITAGGRDALRAWLATPSAPPRLDFEAGVRLILGSAWDDPHTDRAVDEVRRWARERLAALDAAGDPDAERPGAARTAALLRSIYETVCHWADDHAADTSG